MGYESDVKGLSLRVGQLVRDSNCLRCFFFILSIAYASVFKIWFYFEYFNLFFEDFIFLCRVSYFVSVNDNYEFITLADIGENLVALTIQEQIIATANNKKIYKI